MRPARVENTLSCQGTWQQGKNGSEGTVYEVQEGQQPRNGVKVCVYVWGCIAISSSRSVIAVKRIRVSTGLATEPRSVRAWMSLIVGSGVVYAAWSMAKMMSLARSASARGWEGGS
jgi:hypothetical protein